MRSASIPRKLATKLRSFPKVNMKSETPVLIPRDMDQPQIIVTRLQCTFRTSPFSTVLWITTCLGARGNRPSWPDPGVGAGASTIVFETSNPDAKRIRVR